MHKVNLGEACSKEKGVQDPTSFALADLLLGIGAAEEMEKGAPAKRCSVCGFSQADFKKTGRLGCSECYGTFAEGLGSLLKAMHKGTDTLESCRNARSALWHSTSKCARSLKICKKPWLTRTTKLLHRCAIKSNRSKLIFPIPHEILKHAFYCGRMAAR